MPDAEITEHPSNRAWQVRVWLTKRGGRHVPLAEAVVAELDQATLYAEQTADAVKNADGFVWAEARLGRRQDRLGGWVPLGEETQVAVVAAINETQRLGAWVPRTQSNELRRALHDENQDVDETPPSTSRSDDHSHD